MGELSNTLDEFSEISGQYYEKIREILKDKYCWKCPMRSTSSKTLCREVDAWIRLTSAFEAGIHDNLLSKDISNEDLEIITSKYLAKVMRKHNQTINYEKTVILKLKEDMEPFAKKGDLLFIKENPGSVRKGDLVLWPQICPVSTYWFSKVKLAGYVPFKILKVKKAFHKGGCRYIQTEYGSEIPLEYLTGKIIKIMDKNDDMR